MEGTGRAPNYLVRKRNLAELSGVPWMPYSMLLDEELSCGPVFRMEYRKKGVKGPGASELSAKCHISM